MSTVLSAVPEEAIDLVKKFGLLSSEAVLENPEVLKAILASRKGTDWEETTEEFTERVKEKLKDKFWGDAMRGPSALFGEPDWDRITDEHPLKKLKTRLIRINLEKLLGDFPDTRIVGSELVPYDPEGPEHQGDKRHKDITLEKVLEYSKMDPSLLWENYEDTSTYAGDVPHAQIITPMGKIPPEYIQFIMNKKSSAAPDKKFETVPVTGPEAIAAAIDTYSVEEIEDEAVKLLKAGTKTKRPLAVRLLRYVKGFRRNNINPSDYIIRNVPVIPPKFRPFSVVGDSFVPGAANELYRDLFSVLKTHNDVEKVLGRGASGDHKLNVYDSVKAVYGFGEPVLPKTKQRGVGGFLKQITGNTAKFSFFQRKLISKPVDMTGRAVIGVDPDLDLDQIGLPYDTAFKIYSPFIQRRLVRGGMPRTEAIKAVLEKAPTAMKTLQDIVKERPVMYSREPAWHRFNVVAGYPKLIEGKTFMISPLVTTGLNADFDGDTINVHVPGLPEAVEEAKEKLLPSKMLFSIRGGDKVMATPGQELILGLYTAQHRPASNKYTFSSEEEALEAIKNNKVKFSDEIEIE